jgi:SAM-dependent methyltransferase
MADIEVAAFVRANLPPPPCRVLEVGAGEGELATALAEAGYAVTAIDPDPRGDNVHAVALGDLDTAAGLFAGAAAIRSLHHVHPLEPSLGRLAEALTPGAPLVVDEMDVAAFDRRAADWWLRQQAAQGETPQKTADQLVEEHRAHLHPLDMILEALGAWFTVGAPVRGPWLYRWNLGPSFRVEEETLIASGEIPAMGARIVAIRRHDVLPNEA